jgi:hypothetical protein
MHLTLVHASIDGDVRFPDIEPGEWQEISRVERSADARNPYDLSFIELTRHCTGVASVRMRDCCSATPKPSVQSRANL